jgi:SAM-dependent methyltransferase
MTSGSADRPATRPAGRTLGRAPLDQVARSWSTLGAADPLWAVCVDQDRRRGSWDLGEFMASGRAEVATAMDRLGQLGVSPGRIAALDFGCGVGRLTAALADHFDTVTGLDIAEPMLARARALLAGTRGCAFVRNDEPDLRIFADHSFDLVYSSLVLQHMPRPVAANYLREFVRVVRPGGAVVVVVPEAHRKTPKGLVYALAPQPLIGLMQCRLFGYPAPMQMRVLPARRVRRIVEAAGGRLAGSDPAPSVGPHWRGYCHFVTV